MQKTIIIALLFVLGTTMSVFSQTLKVAGFKITSDVSATRLEEKDINGIPCGLIKIGLPMPDAKFVGNVKKSIYKNGEWWVYMTNNSKMITIKTSQYPPLKYNFPEPIQSNVTYVMTVEKPNPYAVKDGAALWRSVILPGWGQFYKGRNSRGTWIVIGETLTLATGGISLYNEMTQKKIMDKPEVSYQEYLAAEQKYNKCHIVRNITFISAAVIYGLNLIDAYKTPANPSKSYALCPDVINANGELAVGATIYFNF